MPRGKKGGRGGPRGSRGGRGGSRGRGGHSDTLPPIWQQAGFTLMDTARETSRHDHKTWGLGSLRSKPVTFISAGDSEPLKQLEDLLQHDVQVQNAKEPAQSPKDCHAQQKTQACEPSIQANGSVTSHMDEETQSRQAPSPQDSADGERGNSPVPFYFDVGRTTQASSAPAKPLEMEKRPLSRQSDSSEEVILFKGRDSRPSVEEEEICMAHMRQEITVVETEIETQLATKRHDTALVVGSERSRKKRPQRRDQRPPKKSTSEDDALLADYIDNMRENGEEDVLLQMLRNQQDIGGSDYIPSEESDVDSTRDLVDATNPDLDVSQGPQSRLETAADESSSESELDDETLAQLLAGHELGHNPIPFADADSSDSDSSEDQQGWVDDLDVMDWDRPSLQRKKGKGAKARLQIEVSDSELEQTLQVAWKNDRFKKAERKRQREEMRALGQLGRNAKPEDLRLKYPQGISIDEVAEEMRVFLQGTNESLALPPMDKHARKVIHDLANKFNIKSKSVGNADNRRPTLYRTKRTQQYSAASFDQALNRVNRRYFPRLDGRRGKGAPRTIGSGRVNMAAATVQEGEIVGGTAPELSVENRGRAMLEKMGWSKGTALGALDNKGILQPVSHAMKRSKAGLG